LRHPAEITVGVISDTHGLLRPEALEALRDSNLILHAGDVGPPDILEALRCIAPVKAVRGNIDTAPWCDSLPQTEVIEAGGLSLYMLHDLKQLDLNPSASEFAAVICGHSHAPMNEVRKGVLYFNPASAGPRRFKLPICAGKLHISSGKITGEIIDLASAVKHP
jgi:putative phosphoesterase